MTRVPFAAAFRCVALVTLALAVTGPGARLVSAFPQDPDPHAGHAAPAAPAASADTMQHRQQMMAEMKAADEKLAQLVSAMNDARGNARVEAIAQAVTELARQQQAMHAHTATMCQGMMGEGAMPMGGRGMMNGR